MAKPILKQVPVVEDEILLLDISLDNNIVARSIEAYTKGGRTLVSVESLFDTLIVKYQLYVDRLIVWRDEKEYILPLNVLVTDSFFGKNTKLEEVYWANDGYSLFLDISALSDFFGVPMDVNRYQLRLNINTTGGSFQFPLQKIALLRQQRILAAAAQWSEDQEVKAPPITLDDQYRIVTMPQGRVSGALTWDQKRKDNNFSVQLVSDLLYHSADLTLGKVNGEDLSANLRLSRYKTRPDKLILGAFDSYSFGDVSGVTNSLTSSANAGLGVTVDREPLNFRRRNLAVTLDETAPPGWEAELFHNNRFLLATRVPDNGRLLFEDVPTEYGNNYYQIKLYGPFGEVEVIERVYDLNTNALSGGAKAYNVYALDNRHQVINDKNDEDYSVTDFGGTFDYGITDYWQFGVGFSAQGQGTGNDQQLYSMKNALTLPGMLLENDVSLSQDGGYAQLTSLIGNAYGNQRFSLAYESARDFSSSRVDATDSSIHAVSGSYNGSVFLWSYSFGGSYGEQDDLSRWRVSNFLSRTFGMMNFSHVLDYTVIETELNNGVDANGDPVLDIQSDGVLSGSLGLAGKLINNLRISGSINYEPAADDPILGSSAISLQWNPKPFGINNYITANYYPIVDSSNKWSLGYNVAWDSKQLQYTFASTYNAQDQWTLSAGIQFFLGYDYHNNRTLMRSYASASSAQLDVHTYLDRQANGRPDPLDHNLPGVTFSGSPDWEGISSGESGRTILPALPANGATYFGATWKEGSATVNNDYVVYTHPGASIDVNMPFYLSSEIMGFVVREGSGNPIAHAKIVLTGQFDSREATTDADGYFEFVELSPDKYEVKVAADYLADKGYTGDVVGYTVVSPRVGGFVELAEIELRRKDNVSDNGAERIVPFEITPKNSEAIIKDDNARRRRNYFNLPVKEKVEAAHSLPAESEVSSTAAAENQQKAEQSAPAKLVAAPHPVRGVLPSVTMAAPGSVSSGTATSGAALSSAAKAASGSTTVVGKQTEVTQVPSITIQLGALSTREQAESLVKNFTDLAQKPEIHQGTSKGASIFRVIVGSFKTRDLAQRFAREHLSDKKYYIRKRAPDEME